jgi:glycine/D-amino acid oxidase-like deaminating enzyme
LAAALPACPAYELSQRGRSVIVIDRGPIAGGMTARTSAHLAPLCDDLMSEMQKIKGEDQSKLFYESQAAAVDRIEEIQKSEGIDCDLRRLDGYLFQGDEMPADVIDEELDAVRAVGAAVERLVGVPLSGCDSRHALPYPRQATFHPLKYLARVAAACAKRGVRFFADTAADEIVEEKWRGDGQDRAGSDPCRPCRRCHQFIDRRPRGAAFENLGLPNVCHCFAIDRGALQDALCWDTEEPYHYVRLQPGNNGMDFVLVGGEDHKSGEADDADKRFKRLEQWARRKMLMLKDVTDRWSGQVLDTIDYAGFVGKNPGSEYIYVATGDSGQGLTHGVMGAILNATLVTGAKANGRSCMRPTASH